jgi:hypothetical protein
MTNEDHINFIEKELQWLQEVVHIRLQLYFSQDSEYKSIYELEPPKLEDYDSLYTQIIAHYGFGYAERLILILALAPSLAPSLLDPFLTQNKLYNRPFAEFGGVSGKRFSGFIPTMETAFFLLAGNDLKTRFQVQAFFQKEHPFQKFQILNLETAEKGEPEWSSVLGVSEEYMSYLTTGNDFEPSFGSAFPAQKINTKLSWEDLVLSPQLKKEIESIGHWIVNQDTILRQWGFERHLKPGFRALFYGPPGTGKSLTAALLGQMTQMDVYRIDLSQVVSKYIGETEKNMARVFDSALHKNWILFFDEADALFGRRTVAKDSKDRYANQETAYLLQRIEDFPGIVILASNLKMNIDEAFSRRFQSMIHFPVPDARQRLILWENIFSSHQIFDESVQLEKLAFKFEMAGGAIINVLRYCTLLAVQRDPPLVSHEEVERGNHA